MPGATNACSGSAAPARRWPPPSAPGCRARCLPGRATGSCPECRPRPSGSGGVNEAREAVLAAVRAALGDRPESSPQVPPPAPAPAPDLVSLFQERVREYRADVRAVSDGGVAEAVAAVCAEHGARRIAAPNDLPPAWLPACVEVVSRAQTAAELDAVDGVVTGCALAIAETGTIVLDGGPAQGSRSLTLVPDLHICVVAAAQVVAGVADAVSSLGEAVRARRAPVTL